MLLIFLSSYYFYLRSDNVVGGRFPVSLLNLVTNNFSFFGDGNFLDYRLKAFNNNVDAQVYIFGNSIIHRGIDPTILDNKDYQFWLISSRNQTMINNYFFFSELKRRNVINYVLLDVYWAHFLQGQWRDSVQQYISHYIYNQAILDHVIFFRDQGILLNWFGASLISIFYLRPDKGPVREVGIQSNSKGFITFQEDKFIDNSGIFLNQKIPIEDNVQFEFFERILRESQESGIDVILLSQPILPSLNDKIKNRHDVQKKIKTISERYSAHFLAGFDLETFGEKPEVFFSDPQHLNKEGASRYSGWLASKLKKVMK